jgi:putative transposase
LEPRDIEQRAAAILQDNVKLKDAGPKCRGSVLLHIVLYAAVRISSIADSCARLKNVPGDDAVRKALAGGLPPIGVLTGRLNRALLDCLPPRVRRRQKRGFRLAIDVTLIPYHGKPFANEREIYRGEAKSGTTHFHAYATCYLVHHGQRFTLAMLYVLKGTPLQSVLRTLLKIVEKAGIRPRVLLLDRGFYQAPVVRALQASRIPFLMPMIMRGRKSSHPKGPSGTYVFTAQKKGGPTSYTWKGKDGKDCTVKVYRVRTRDKKSRRMRTLVYIYAGFRPMNGDWVRKTYRLRFGIESSYRQMNQARIYTCTRNPLLRLFYVGVALVLRNVWVWLHLMTLSEPRQGGRKLRLEKLRLRVMYTWLIHFIETIYELDDATEAQFPTNH